MNAREVVYCVASVPLLFVSTLVAAHVQPLLSEAHALPAAAIARLWLGLAVAGACAAPLAGLLADRCGPLRLVALASPLWSAALSALLARPIGPIGPIGPVLVHAAAHETLAVAFFAAFGRVCASAKARRRVAGLRQVCTGAS